MVPLRYDAAGPSISFSADAADSSASLRWHVGDVAPMASLDVTRSPGLSGSKKSVVYQGDSSGFNDRRVRNGVRYTYTITARDRAGNTSTRTIEVTPNPRLLAPLANAHISSPPLLSWTPVRGASYYNVQLYRSGKVLSAWPKHATFQLRGTWKFEGRRYRLKPGRYTWYVWPGVRQALSGSLRPRDRPGHVRRDAQLLAPALTPSARSRTGDRRCRRRRRRCWHCPKTTRQGSPRAPPARLSEGSERARSRRSSAAPRRQSAHRRIAPPGSRRPCWRRSTRPSPSSTRRSPGRHDHRRRRARRPRSPTPSPGAGARLGAVQDRLVPATAQLVGQRLRDAGQLIRGERDSRRAAGQTPAVVSGSRTSAARRHTVVVAAGPSSHCTPKAACPRSAAAGRGPSRSARTRRAAAPRRTSGARRCPPLERHAGAATACAG